MLRMVCDAATNRGEIITKYYNRMLKRRNGLNGKNIALVPTNGYLYVFKVDRSASIVGVRQGQVVHDGVIGMINVQIISKLVDK